MTTWDTQDTGAVAAHEFGHMLGLVDEYSDSNCPGRSPVNTGTIMDNNSNVVPDRMMTRFANNIGSNVVAI
jgi:bacillopeptidase F (M6 metalloprotease family)